jgi:hypothetical protein
MSAAIMGVQMGGMSKLGWLIGWFTRDMWSDSLYFHSSQLGYFFHLVSHYRSRSQKTTIPCSVGYITKLTSWNLSPSWEATSCAATDDFRNILWNSNLHYRVHKSHSMVHILSQINPVHATPLYLCMINFNTLFTHLLFVLLSGLFTSGFPPGI